MAAESSRDVAVLIPTLRRPDSLERALQSVFAQTALDRLSAIVVVDNDPAASAAYRVEQLTAQSPVALT